MFSENRITFWFLKIQFLKISVYLFNFLPTVQHYNNIDFNLFCKIHNLSHKNIYIFFIFSSVNVALQFKRRRARAAFFSADIEEILLVNLSNRSSNKVLGGKINGGRIVS